MSDKIVVLCDGMNIFMRNYIANPAMDVDGNPIGGIAGSLSMLGTICAYYNPEDVIIVWEGGGAPRRRAIYSDYKKGRVTQKLNRFYSEDIPDTDENRVSQVAKLTKILQNLPITQVYVSDCEADDIIGYLARYKLKDYKTVIVSSDKDMYQLVDDSTVVWSPGQKKEIGINEIVKKFNIHPKNFCLARAISGDKSDNLGGIPRAGYRTLAKRFPGLFSDVEMTFDAILNECKEQLNKSKIKLYKNILEGEQAVWRNLKLMRLDISNLSATQIQKVESVLETYQPKYDKIGFMRSLNRFGMRDFRTDRLFFSMNYINRSKRK
jgi:DNA polymerase-1